MTIAALEDYLPLADLGKIVLACLLVAVIAPVAVGLSIVGDERRNRGYLVVGAAIVAALLAAGLYTLFAG